MLRNIILLGITIIIGAGFTYMLDYNSNPRATLENVETPMQEESGYRENEAVPDFSFTTITDENVNISDFRGKTVVLNFWASWCAPCVKEFPYFLKLAEDYPDQVVFIGLSNDHDLKAMDRFLSKMEKENPQAMERDNVLIALDDGGKITRNIFQTFRLPETIIIDDQGNMKHKLIGADWTYSDLENLIKNQAGK